MPRFRSLRRIRYVPLLTGLIAVLVGSVASAQVIDTFKFRWRAMRQCAEFLGAENAPSIYDGNLIFRDGIGSFHREPYYDLGALYYISQISILTPGSTEGEQELKWVAYRLQLDTGQEDIVLFNTPNPSADIDSEGQLPYEGWLVLRRPLSHKVIEKLVTHLRGYIDAAQLPNQFVEYVFKPHKIRFRIAPLKSRLMLDSLKHSRDVTSIEFLFDFDNYPKESDLADFKTVSGKGFLDLGAERSVVKPRRDAGRRFDALKVAP